jgi:hypothetical protein
MNRIQLQYVHNAKPNDTYEFENGEWLDWIGELLCCVLLVYWCIGVLVCWLGNKRKNKRTKNKNASVMVQYGGRHDVT